MPAKSTQLCEEMVTYLSGLTFNVTVDFQRTNFVVARAELMKNLTCFVHPLGITQQVATRGNWRNDYTIGITLCQLLNTMQISEQDELIEVAEQLPLRLIEWIPPREYLYLDTIAGEGTRLLFDEIQMETYTVFTCEMMVTYRNEEY